MNYIAQIKGFWMLHEKHAFSSTDISLYFYLLEVCNSANWVNLFKRNNNKVLADLKISRSSLERSRRRLSVFGILKYKSHAGTANIIYQLVDLEVLYRDRYKEADAGCDAGTDATADAGCDGLNKNSKQKQKPKQVKVVTHATAFDFFVHTCNCNLLKQRYHLDNEGIAAFFKTFYDSKIDLGDLNNKTLTDIARNFYYWLPIHLSVREKEKSCAKKESFYQQKQLPPQRGVAAAIKFANVKMRGAV